VIFARAADVSIVVPGFSVFPHSMREAWAVLLRDLGVSFRWIVHREGESAKTAKTIGPQGLVILLNDHHLADLTAYLHRANGFGRGRDERLWLGLSTERIVGSPFPASEEKTRLTASLCHLVAHFDPFGGDLIRREGAEPLFIHQYVDALTYRPQKKFEEKIPKVFWVGKLPAGQTVGEYESRARLWEAVRGLRGFSWREACRPDLSIAKVVLERDGYQALLNLPSNCPGYTATFFEHLAMGAVVLQYRTGTPLPTGLQPGRHFFEYDPEQPDELTDLVAEVSADPSHFKNMALEGREVCLSAHTLHHRVAEIGKVLFRRLGVHGFPPADSAAGKTVKNLLQQLARRGWNGG
jgi:hypothetical protein